MNPLDTAKRQVLYSTAQLRDCCLRSSYDIPQIPEHCSPTKCARVSSCSHGDVVMLFCPSFTQSERFLQTDQLIIRFQVVVMTNFIRMLMRNVFVNVFETDAVIWWAAIFRRLRTAAPLARLGQQDGRGSPDGIHRCRVCCNLGCRRGRCDDGWMRTTRKGANRETLAMCSYSCCERSATVLARQASRFPRVRCGPS